MSNHRRNRRRGPAPRGFSGPVLGPIHRVLLPIGGREKRELFNRISRWTVALAGLTGTIFGYGLGGPLGAVLGLGVSLSGAARMMVRNRFHRG